MYFLFNATSLIYINYLLYHLYLAVYVQHIHSNKHDYISIHISIQ